MTMSAQAKSSLPQSIVIKGLEITPPLVLAPMAGLTHSALRRVIAECGGCGLLFTEMLSVRTLPNENSDCSPWLVRDAMESPLCFQILVASPEQIAPALDKLHTLHADAIDINLGCMAPKVRRQGAGHALATEHQRLQQVVRKARRCTDLPLSAKIRLGQKDGDPATSELVHILEDCGIDLLYVHARLAGDGFSRPPRWKEAARVTNRLSIPVIINGGISSAEDAEKCLAVTGAAGLMIGRAAATAPWIFREIAARLLPDLFCDYKAPAPPDIYQRFTDILQQRFPTEKQLGRLKEFTHYFSKNYKFGHQLAWKVQNAKSVAEAIETAQAFFSRNEHGRDDKYK